MIYKYNTINPLTIEERHLIKEAIDLNMSYGEMAKHVGRVKSIVRRESVRLGHYSLYDPEKAQQQFEMKMLNSKRGKKIER